MRRVILARDAGGTDKRLRIPATVLMLLSLGMPATFPCLSLPMRTSLAAMHVLVVSAGPGG